VIREIVEPAPRSTRDDGTVKIASSDARRSARNQLDQVDRLDPEGSDYDGTVVKTVDRGLRQFIQFRTPRPRRNREGAVNKTTDVVIARPSRSVMGHDIAQVKLSMQCRPADGRPSKRRRLRGRDGR
jgi:polyribonucleotide nucleotidyltransferase